MKQALLKLIVEDEDGWEEFVEDGFWTPDGHPLEGVAKTLTEAGFSIKQVDQHGGEGQDDEYWIVFSVTKGDETKCFQLSGWYRSFQGHAYDDYLDFHEVEVMVKHWRAVNGSDN